MDVRTIHASDFPNLAAGELQRFRQATYPVERRHDNLGAFRGLLFALGFEAAAAAAVFAAWEFWHFLR